MTHEEFDVFVAHYAEFRRSLVEALIVLCRLPDDIDLDRWADDGGRA